MKFETPILFLIFNRPDTTKRVFERIREIKPKYLFVAADGPREGKVGEKELTKQVRQIATAIDWDCEVKTLFRNGNLGCGKGVSTAIDWFFEHVEMGIILEDDVIPELSFFNFCKELLIKYKDDKNIWHISGNNFNVNTKKSFFISNYPFIWGWATWKRAWANYHYKLFNDDDNTIRKVIKQTQFNKQSSAFWIKTILKLKYSHSFFTWDYQWFYTLWKNNASAILPSKNLVKNIGFDENATHTIDPEHKLSNLQTHEIIFPLDYPKRKKTKRKYDLELFYQFYEERHPLLKTLINSFSNTINNIIRKSLRSVLWRFLPETRVLFNDSFAWDYYKNTLFNSKVSSKAKKYPPYKLIDSSVADYSYIAPNSVIIKTKIGKFCSIGPNFMCGYGIHPTNGISTSPMFYSTQKQNGFSLTDSNKINEQEEIIIGNDVFIGMNVTVLDGVSIGNGAVIGAGAVVTKDIPDYAIAIGVPAKVIRFRFDEKLRKELIKTNWFDYNFEELKQVEEYFWKPQEFVTKNIRNEIKPK